MRWNSVALKKMNVVSLVVYTNSVYIFTKSGYRQLRMFDSDRMAIKWVKEYVGSPITSIRDKYSQTWMWYDLSVLDKLHVPNAATYYSGPVNGQIS